MQIQTASENVGAFIDMMDMASAVKVDFTLWDSLSLALRELGY